MRAFVTDTGNLFQPVPHFDNDQDTLEYIDNLPGNPYTVATFYVREGLDAVTLTISGDARTVHAAATAALSGIAAEGIADAEQVDN